ncbi:uncharacterized protein EAF01_006424 [Botrytis porri]|uniref:uncharacterized protein n=1 Tax=Botrytis porri TaxID=87229 RepID=UPI0018FF8DDD|nr:uncharacterized protein EAF01_006424 [Botrytis porri]KAF7903375.1 hypothetical protein EAF01_006424 [Botrytis porri]
MSEVRSNRNRSILPHIINLNIPFLVLEIPEITAIILIQKPLNPSAFRPFLWTTGFQSSSGGLVPSLQDGTLELSSGPSGSFER